MKNRSAKTICLLLLTACGGTDPGDARAPLRPTDIQQIWDIRQMTCAGSAITPAPGEYYRLDDTHVVRIEKISEDDASLCRVGYVFDKVVGTSNLDESAYQEAATLRSAGSKTTCWNKENGAPVEPPVSDTIGEFGPETRGLEMTTTPELVALEIGAGSRCPEGILQVELALR